MSNIEQGPSHLNHEELTEDEQKDIVRIAHDLGSRPSQYRNLLHEIDSRLHQGIAELLIRTQHGHELVPKLHFFKDLDFKIIISKLIEKNYTSQLIIFNLDKFEGISHYEVAMELIGAQRGWDVAKHLKMFKDTDHKAIAIKLIETGQIAPLASHINNFEDLDHEEIVNKMIEAGGGFNVAGYQHNFHDLSAETREKIEKIKKEMGQ